MKPTSLTAVVLSLLSQQAFAGWYGKNYQGFGTGFGGGYGSGLGNAFGSRFWLSDVGSGIGGGYGSGIGLGGFGGNGGFWSNSYGSPYTTLRVVLYPIVLPSGSGSLWGPIGGWYGNSPVGYWGPSSSPYSVWFSGPPVVSQPGAGLWGPRMLGSPAMWYTSGNLGGQSASGGLYRSSVLGGTGDLSGVGPSVYDGIYDDSTSVGSISPSSWSRQNGGFRFPESPNSFSIFSSFTGSRAPQSGIGGSFSLVGDDTDNNIDLSSGDGSYGRVSSLPSFVQMGRLGGYDGIIYSGSPYMRFLCHVTGLSPSGVQRLYREYRRSGVRSSFLTYLRRRGYLGGNYGGFPFGFTEGSGSQPGSGGSFFNWRSQPSSYYSWGTPMGLGGSGSYGSSSYPSGANFDSSSSWSSGSSGSYGPQIGQTQVKIQL